MLVSKRVYYRNLLLALLVIGVLIFTSAPVANKYLFHLKYVDDVCKYGFVCETIIAITVLLTKIIKHKGLKNYICMNGLRSSIESNLMSIGAYSKRQNKAYVVLPKIRIKNNEIRIILGNLKIRTILERYLDSFSTALPDKYVVEDYYISQNSAEVIIMYENMRNYKPERYCLEEYIKKIKTMDLLSLYFDRKHTVNMKDRPHFLISGSSGSGKTYLVNQLVMQAIVKEWQVVILDIKRSYGLYKAYSEYYYETVDIIKKLQSVEAEMASRMEKLQSELDVNPGALAVDIGYKPMLVVIEEYISLQSSLEKKQREELERIVKNLSVLARQSNIHLLMVMQSAGTENINATTRSNLTKVLLGNAQSNIMTATFGTGVDIPNLHSKMNKGEGLIQLDRISILRVPEICDMDDFKNVIV